MSTEKNDLLTIQQAANVLGVSTKTLRRWEEAGIIKPDRTVGNQRRYTLSHIESLKNKPKVPQRLSANPKPTPAKPYLTNWEQRPLPDTNSFPKVDYLNLDIKSESGTPTVGKFLSFKKFSIKYTIPLLVLMVAGFMALTTSTNVLGLSKYLPGAENAKGSKENPEQSVLAAITKATGFKGILTINIPTFFNDTVNIDADLIVRGNLITNGDSLITGNATVSGQLTAPNILYTITAGQNLSITGDPQNPIISADASGVTSLAGQTGELSLSGGSGIGIDGLTISNTDPGSAQNIFKNIEVGGSTITAGSNNDTLEFAAGSGITLTTDTGNKRITIDATSSGPSGLTPNGVLYADTPNSFVSLTPGSAGFVLQSNGSGSPPSWVANSGANPSFSVITSGTNTSAVMVVGSGASLNFSGTGTINASTLGGATFASPGPIGSTTASTGSFTTITASGNITAANFTGSSSGTNTGDVTLAGENYLSLVGQVITANPVNLSNTNVTGTLAAARFGALTGDVTSAGGTYATTIAADAVALGTDTTGDYVGTITGGNGVSSTGATTGENIAHTLSINLTTSGTTGSTTSNSGLEVGAGGLSLLKGCGDAEVLKWNETSSLWECATDAGGSGSAGIINIQNNDISVGSNVDTIDFSSDFSVIASPTSEANVSIDYATSNIVRRNQNETISGNWIFSSATPLAFSNTAPSISIANTGTLSITDGTNTLCSIADAGTTGNLSCSGTVSATGTITASNLSGTNTGDVTLAGQNYLTIAGQVITANAVDLSGTHVTGILAAARFGALTGDVTSAGGTYATTIAADAVALGTDTTGDYVATLTSGNGISSTATGEGSTPTIALAALTANWNQTGAFDIVLNNASSELQILESTGGTFFGSLDVGDLSANRTYTFPDATGDVCLSTGNCAGVGGNGDITSVGDVTTGAAFDGTAGNSLQFEGATADGFETTLTSVDATQDNTINLPNASGTVAVSASGVISLSSLGDITCPTCVTSGGSGASKWTDSGTLTYLTATSDSVTIGSANELGKLAVDGDADETQLLIQGNATQTAMLAVFENSAGVDQFTIANNGNVVATGTITASNFTGSSSGTNTGDVTLAGHNYLSIAGQVITAGDVALGTHTSGDYVATITGGAGLTGLGNTEGSTPTIAVGAGNGITVNADDIAINLTIAGTTGSTSSNSGLEVGSGGLTLLKGCVDGETLKYTDALGWACATDINAGGDITSVGDVTSGAAFDGTQGNSLQFEGSTADGFETTLTSVDPTADNTISLPNASGTVAVSASGNIALSALGNITFTGQLPIANGGTNGTATPTAGAIAYGTGTAYAFSSAGTAGQAVLSGGAGTPTFTTGTLTLAGNFATSGASSLTLTTTGATNVTLPTTGTLATLAGTETLSNKTLTAPRFADLGFIADANGNEMLIFDTVASAVNELTLTNAATSGTVTLAATGTDTNIPLSINTKGTGALNLNNTATGDILLGGGSGSTGCTVTNSTGAFACTAALSSGTFSSANFTGSSSGTNTGDQTITLTGDVTGSGTGSFATTIADNSVDGTDIALGSDAQGDLMYYDGTNWVRLAAGTANQLLHSGTTPSWSAVSLIADVSGILPLANGGTNKNMTAATGQVAYSDADSLELTTGGSSGQCLVYQSGSAPIWTDCTSAASSPFSASGGVITKVTAGDRLSLRYGDATDTQLEIENTTSGTIPTADAASINLTGGTTGIVTDGVDGLFIGAEFGNGTTNTNSGIRIDIDPVNTPSGDETFYGLNIEGLSAGTAANETAINIGSNWDTILNTANLDISGAGAITGATTGAFSGALSSSTLDTGQGANELYDMNQNVETTSDVTFNSLTLTTDLSVANGGTGASTFTQGGILYGNGTSAIGASTQGTAGQALVSGGAGSPTWTTGTLTLAGNFATSGTSALTLTTTGATNVTLPTTGTLATLAGTETLSNKTLTAPRFADLGFIADANGNEMLIFDTVASAVNELTLTNAATAGTVTLAATGTDTNIPLSINTKGTGALNLNNTATGDILLGGGSGSTGCTVTNSTGAFACTGAVTAATDETINGIDISAGTISDVVNLTINSGGDLTIGTIGLNDVGSSNTTSGASLIGVFDEFANSSGTNVQDVLDDLDAAIGAGSSKFTQGTGFIYLTNSTDSVTIGGTTELAKLAVDGDSDEIQLLVQGNSTQTSNLAVFQQSNGTTNVLTLSNSGLLSTGDLTLGLNDATATISTQDTDESLDINPNGNGGVTLTAGTVTFTVPSNGLVKSSSNLIATTNLGLGATSGIINQANTNEFILKFAAVGNATNNRLSIADAVSGSAPSLNVDSGSTDTNVDFKIDAKGTGNLLLQTTATGNVGIGTTAPSSLFSVGSTSQFQVNSTGAIAAATGIASSGNIDLSSLAAGGLVKAAATTGRLSIATAGTDYENPLTFSNGLTRTVNAVAWGGALTANTTITQDNAETLTFTNAGTASTIFDLTSTGDFDIRDNGTSALFVRDDGNVGIGTTAPAGLLDISKALSGTPSTTGKYLSLSASTFTDNNTAISGTATNMVFNSIARPTLAATNASVTTTDAYTMFIAGAPIAGTNQTITNSYAFATSNQGGLLGLNVLGTGQVGISTPAATDAFLSVGSTGYISFNSSSVVRGINVRPANSGTGDIQGIRSQPISTNTGTTANLVGFQGSIRSAGGVSAIVTSGKAFEAVSPTVSSGAITNQYGLYIEQQDVTGVGTGYGVYQADSGDLNYFNGSVGIGDTGPDAKLEVLSTTEQLRLSYEAADTNIASFTVSSGGDLTINPSGGQLLLGDVDTLNVGGLTGVAYNAFANSGEAPEDGAITADNDLYIGGDLEVDGALIAGTTFNCTDCIDFDDMSDTLSLDASTSITQDNAETLTFTNAGTASTIFDLTSTGDFDIRDNGTSALFVRDDGNVGIGTSTPDLLGFGFKTLTIQGTAVRSIVELSNTSTGTSGVAGTIAGFNGSTILGSFNFFADGAVNSGYLDFWTSNAGTMGERMRITSGGHVGIGDTSPASLFTVGNGDLFQVNASGDIIKLKNLTYSWPSSHAAGVLTNNGSGTLTWAAGGAGTVTSSGSSLANRLSYFTTDTNITGSADLTFNPLSTTGNTLALANNSLTSGSLLNLSINGTGAASNTQKGLNIALSGTNSTSAQTTYGAYISNTHAGTTSTNIGLYSTATGGTTANYAAIFENGNVGIGITNPSQLLTVNGVGMFGTANASEVLLGMSANTAGHEGVSLYHDGTEAFLASVDAATAWQDLTLQANNIRFDMNGSENDLIITSAGDLGIGTTPSNGFRLDVAGSNRNTVAGAPGAGIHTVGSQISLTNSSTATSGTSTFSGINISPTNNAAGSGGTHETVGLTISQIAGSPGAGTQNNYGVRIRNQGLSGAENTYGLYVDTQTGSTNNYAAIFAGGNVGIGTTAPTYNLDVAGQQRITANYGLAGGAASALLYMPFTHTSTNTSGVAQLSGIQIVPTNNSIGSGGTQATYGLLVDAIAGTSGAGTQENYGIRIGNQGQANTELSYGLFVDSQSGSTNSYAATFQGGNVGIGTTTPTRTLDVSGTWGGNVVVGPNDVNPDNGPFTLSTKALAYYIERSGASGNCNGYSATYNITGLPNTEGSFAYIVSKATDNNCGTNALVVTVQINGSTISTVSQGPTGTGTNTENYTVAYINGAWRIVGYGPTAANPASPGTLDTADLAEWIKYTGEEPTEGEVLVTGDEAVSVKRSSIAYDPKLIGVVTTNPHTVMSSDDGQSVKLALSGRIPVKVSSASAAITAGDYVTSSSEPGRAMKATRAGQVIGKALEPWTPNSGKDTVMVLVGTGYVDPQSVLASLTIDGDGNLVLPNSDPDEEVVALGGTPAAQPKRDLAWTLSDIVQRLTNLEQNAGSTSSGQSISATGSAQLDALSGKVDGLDSDLSSLKLDNSELKSRIASLEADISFLASTSATFNAASSSAELGLEDLDVVDLAASGNLNVLGRTTLSDVGITGKMNIGLITLDGLSGEAGYGSINTTTGPLMIQSEGFNGVDILDGKVVIETNGDMRVDGTVTVKKLNVDTEDVASASLGEGVIEAGETTALIETSAVTDKSRIFITPKTKSALPLAVTDQVDGASFTAELTSPALSDIKFNWWIVN